MGQSQSDKFSELLLNGDGTGAIALLHEDLDFKNVFEPGTHFERAENNTVLHFAALSGLLDVLTYFRDTYDLNVAAVNDKGHTPLHSACMRSDNEQTRLEIVKLLVALDSKIVDLPDKEGNSPLHFCAKYGLRQIAEYLLPRGASLTRVNIAKKSPADLAQENKHEWMAAQLEAFMIWSTGIEETQECKKLMDVKQSGLYGLNVMDIRAEKDLMLIQVSEMLALDMDLADKLLRAHQYDIPSLANAWWSDKHAACAKAGVDLVALERKKRSRPSLVRDPSLPLIPPDLPDLPVFTLDSEQHPFSAGLLQYYSKNHHEDLSFLNSAFRFIETVAITILGHPHEQKYRTLSKEALKSAHLTPGNKGFHVLQLLSFEPQANGNLMLIPTPQAWNKLKEVPKIMGQAKRSLEQIMRARASNLQLIEEFQQKQAAREKRKARENQECKIRGVFTEEGDCGVCFSPGKLLCLEVCEHGFCRDCWTYYLESKINEGDVDSLRCQEIDCPETIPNAMVDSLLSLDLKRKFLRFDLSKFVEHNDDLKWCPRPGCDRAIMREDTAVSRATDIGIGLTVSCGNGHVLCFDCLEDPHEPCTCAQWQRWKTENKEIFQDGKSAADTIDSIWIKENTKTCPSCKQSVQKNAGCNHMTCRCGYEWCWICLGKWSGHQNFYSCNRYSGEGSTQAADYNNSQEGKRVETERKLHYIDRYLAHNNSLRLEAQMLANVGGHVAQLEQVMADAMEVQADFLQHSLEELLLCRQLVRSSYPFIYYMNQDDKNAIDAFERGQERLLDTVEYLSNVVARHRVTASRDRIIHAALQARQARLDLLEDGRKGVFTQPGVAASLSNHSDSKSKRNDPLSPQALPSFDRAFSLRDILPDEELPLNFRITRPVSDNWSCPVCTLYNHDSNVCAACGNAKPPPSL